MHKMNSTAYSYVAYHVGIIHLSQYQHFYHKKLSITFRQLHNKRVT